MNKLVLVPFLIACGGSPSNPPATVDAPPMMMADGPPIDMPMNPPVAELLADNELRPSSLAAYSGTVFWTTDPATGMGQTRRLVPGNPVSSLSAAEDRPGSLAVGMGLIDVEAFWGTASLLGQIRQIKITGAPPISGASVNDVVYSLALDGDSVFVGTRSTVYKKNVANSASPVSLAGGFGNGVTAITADATGVAFATRLAAGGWIIATVARTGGPVTTLVTMPDAVSTIRDIAIVGNDVYWTLANTIHKVPRGGGAESTVKIFNSPDRPWALLAQAGKLYIVTNQGVLNPTGATGDIIEWDPASGAEKVIATDQPEPSDVAIDAGYYYWANRGVGAANKGQIWRIRRE